MRCRFITATLTLAISFSAGWGQQAVQHQIVCSSTSGDVLNDGAAQIVPISADEAATIIAGSKPIAYEGFDASRFAVSKLTFYLKRTVTKVSQWPNDNAELRIVFSAASASGLSWYEIRATEKVSPVVLLVERTPSHAAERESGIGRVTIIRATPDPAIPLLNISFHTNNDGMNTQADTQTMFLLDVRQLPPALVTSLDCTNLQGGGACTAIDNGMAGSTDLLCDWQAAAQNYSCVKQYDEYYERRITETFALPGKTPLPTHVKAGEPETLIEFAMNIQKDEQWAARKPSIPGLGETTFLFRNSSDKAPAYVFAARGQGEDFNARFFAVLLGNGAPELLEIKPEPMVEWQVQQTNEQDADSAPPPKAKTTGIDQSMMPSGPPLKFAVKKLDATTPADVWQVTVTEGNNHAVNWLAAIPSGSHVSFDSLKIASDGASYSGCGRWAHEQSAIVFRQKNNKVEAEAEVEPPFTDPLSNDAENETDTDQLCPTLVKIKFNLKDGFQLQKGKTLPCSKEHRVVKISEDGAISPTPYVNPADQ